MTEQRWVIDFIEEGSAQIEVDGERVISVAVSLLPVNARAGHVLRVRGEAKGDDVSGLVIEVDEQATREALARSAAQTKKGQRQANDPGGDLKF